MTRALLAALLSVVAGGCTHWPEHGTGGMAEKRPAPAPLLESGSPDPAWLALNRDLADARKRLDLLTAEGANACLPAHVVEARLRENRIARELHGGLVEDAAGALATHRRALSALDGHLQNAMRSGECRPAEAETFALVGPGRALGLTR